MVQHVNKIPNVIIINVFLLTNCTKGKENTAQKVQLESYIETKHKSNPYFPILKITKVINKNA